MEPFHVTRKVLYNKDFEASRFIFTVFLKNWEGVKPAQKDCEDREIVMAEVQG